MCFTNTQMMALSIAFPDVCKTPPFAEPIPYPNLGESTMAIPIVLNQFIECMPIHNILTIVMMTEGDDAGVMGGLISQLDFSIQRHIIGNPKIFSGAMPVTTLLMPTGHNGPLPNMIGITITPSQVKVIAC